LSLISQFTLATAPKLIVVCTLVVLPSNVPAALIRTLFFLASLVRGRALWLCLSVIVASVYISTRAAVQVHTFVAFSRPLCTWNHHNLLKSTHIVDLILRRQKAPSAHKIIPRKGTSTDAHRESPFGLKSRRAKTSCKDGAFTGRGILSPGKSDCCMGWRGSTY